MTFPFERNHYFYGKLLTAGDFQAEQRYHSQKRQLLNRLLLGGGVLIGLSVTRLDDKTIEVQSGVALDSSGREIVVPYATSKNVSLLTGFSYNTQQCYLCIAYAEFPFEEALSIDTDGTAAFGKVREGFSLYLTTQAPTEKNATPPALHNMQDDIEPMYLACLRVSSGNGTFFIDTVEDIRHILTLSPPEPPPPPPQPNLDPLVKAVERLIQQYQHLSRMRPTVASGMVRIDFSEHPKRHQTFMSAPIQHGLGPGCVSVTLAIMENNAQSAIMGGHTLVFGSPSVFGLPLSTAAKVDEARGTFVVGVRLLETVVQTHVRIYWSVIRNNGELPPAPTTALEIVPPVVTLRCNETYRFKTDGIGIDPNALLWYVMDSDRGNIDSTGVFEADVPGIYTVKVVAGKDSALAFAIVKP